MKNILEKLEGRTIAVTGARGYIGSTLVEKLTKYTSNIICVSRQDMKIKGNVQTLQADIRTSDCWREIVERADIIFHLAGNTSVYAAAKDPVDSLKSTLLPITYLIRAAQKLGRKPRVIFASTATIYGLNEQLPITETTEPNPITVYDLHKLFAEKQLSLAADQGYLECLSMRLANVYGPGLSDSLSSDRGVLNKVTTLALQGRNLVTYGDGNYLRDYIYIDDVVNAFILASIVPDLTMRSCIVASGIGTTLKHAFEKVIKSAALKTGKNVELGFTPWPSSADLIEYRNFIAEKKGFLYDYGWKPETNLDEGINLLIAEYLEKSA